MQEMRADDFGETEKVCMAQTESICRLAVRWKKRMSPSSTFTAITRGEKMLVFKGIGAFQLV